MVDKKGHLCRMYDNFKGTVAVMDFHGYTKFSNDIKYNKTPLVEFGNTLPQKIELICKKNQSFVYEIEGDSLILIGPENPYFVLSSVISIIELASQQAITPNDNLKKVL